MISENVGNGSLSRWPLASIFGILAVLLNVAAIGCLGEFSAAYQPGQMDNWMEEMVAHPLGAAASAWLFEVGVLCLIPFALGVRRSLRGSRELAGVASSLIVAGALMNAAACLAPFIVTRQVAGAAVAGDSSALLVGRVLLEWAISMDALFNLLFGFGLVLAGIAMWSSPQYGSPLSVLGVVAGLNTMVVVFQVDFPAAAHWLIVAGPLWLAWILGTSYRLIRPRG